MGIEHRTMIGGGAGTDSSRFSEPALLILIVWLKRSDEPARHGFSL